MTTNTTPRSIKLSIWAGSLLVLALIASVVTMNTGSHAAAALTLFSGVAGVLFYVWALLVEARARG